MFIEIYIDDLYERTAFKEMLETYANKVMPVWKGIKDCKDVNKKSYSYKQVEAGVDLLRRMYDKVSKYECKQGEQNEGNWI